MIQAHFPILVRSKKLRRYRNDNHGMRAISIFLINLRSSTPLVSMSPLKSFFTFPSASVEIATLSEPSGEGVLFSMVADKVEKTGVRKKQLCGFLSRVGYSSACSDKYSLFVK